MSKSTFVSLTVEKIIAAPGAWLRWVILSVLFDHGCALRITCHKPIRVSFPIPFIAIIKADFPDKNKDLLVPFHFISMATTEFHQLQNNLSYGYLFIFNLLQVCLVLHVPMCKKNCNNMRCAPA